MNSKISALSCTPITTAADGRFRIELPPGEWELRVVHPAYRLLRQPLTVAAQSLELELRLQWVAAAEESITVTGIRAGDDVPVSKRNMSREEIDKLSYGQDVPQLLQYTPSMTWYSDSGIGANYSYFSMRGIQQTRINVTFDGAPLNDPAEHALYFNNFHDFASTVDSIQIQRGVGTSSVGSPAYGGSVNFASPAAAQTSGGDARLVLGSYGTARASLGYETGLLGNGLWVSGRFSYANTDGYREHSGTEHDTFFLNGGWQGERSSLKFVGFSGREKSQLAYLAVDPDTLAENRRFNPLTEQDRDDFGQDFAQLKYSLAIGEESSFGLMIELGKNCFGKCVPAQRYNGIGFRASEAQILPVQQLHGAIGPQAHHVGRRLGAADDDDAAIRWQLGDGIQHDRMKGRLQRHFLIVVQHQNEWRPQARVKGAEVAPCEGGQIGVVLGGEQRQRAGGGGLRHIVEEGGHVGIAGIQLIPARLRAPSFEIAGDQRGLSGPRRTRHPHDSAAIPLIEDREQTLAANHTGGTRPRDLGARSGTRIWRHGTPPSPLIFIVGGMTPLASVSGCV